MRGTWLLVLLLGGEVLAQTPALSPPPPPPPPPADAPAVEEPPRSRVLKPLQLDTKVSADTDVLLAYVELGASADLGLLPLGPGTLAVGASFDVGFCATVCWAISALTSLSYGQRFYSPMARVRYDFPLPASRASPTERINAYGLLMGGLVLSSAGLSNRDGSLRLEGSDASIGLGLGGGAQYFINRMLFGGVEASLRYARGRYAWRAVVGQYTLSEQQETWSLTGFNVKLSLGVRLP